jgi:hypothetical protein
MIVLDTNVIAELMRSNPDLRVERWLLAQPRFELATTTINLAEIRFGLARLPSGRRRRELELQFDSFAARGFADRVFDFDAPAAMVFGDLVASRQRTGRPIQGFDGLIAAIARSRGCSIATRDITDFAGCEILVIDPWSEAAAN